MARGTGKEMERRGWEVGVEGMSERVARVARVEVWEMLRWAMRRA